MSSFFVYKVCERDYIKRSQRNEKGTVNGSRKINKTHDKVINNGGLAVKSRNMKLFSNEIQNMETCKLYKPKRFKLTQMFNFNANNWTN